MSYTYSSNAETDSNLYAPYEVRGSTIGSCVIYPYIGDDILSSTSESLSQKALRVTSGVEYALAATVEVADAKPYSNLSNTEDTGYKIDITPWVTELGYTQDSSIPGGGASLTLNITEKEAHRLLPGLAVSSVGGYATVASQAAIALKRNMVTGSLVVIGDDTPSNTPLFIGFVTGVSTVEGFEADGTPMVEATIECSNWLYPATIAQLKQVPVSSREPQSLPYLQSLFSKINSSALAPILDSSEGFIQELVMNMRSNTDITTPAQFLQGVVRALFNYRLPKGFLDSDAILGDNVIVFDGGAYSMGELAGQVSELALDDEDSLFQRPAYGNDADIIKSDMFTKFSGLSANNLTHMELITSIFMGLPSIMELIPVVLPARRVGALTQVETKYKVCLGLIYRYKPCTPVHGPTQAGFNRYLAKLGQPPRFVAPTACEVFYGPTLANSYYKAIQSSDVVSVTRRVNDMEHVNAVFIERPFFIGDVHKVNLIQSSAPLIADSTDINRHGMRCFSAASPFYSTKKGAAAKTQELRGLSLATSERVFHSVAGANGYSSGEIIITHPYIVTNYTDKVRPGMWLVVQDSEFPDPTSDDAFTCYVQAVSLRVFVDFGVVTTSIVISYERGSYGARIAIPDTVPAPTLKPSRAASKRAKLTLGTPETKKYTPGVI